MIQRASGRFVRPREVGAVILSSWGQLWCRNVGISIINNIDMTANCLKYRVLIAEISLLIKNCEITLVNLIFILVISLKKEKKVPLTFPWKLVDELMRSNGLGLAFYTLRTFAAFFSHIWCLKNANQKSWKFYRLSVCVKILCFTYFWVNRENVTTGICTELPLLSQEKGMFILDFT